MIDRLKQLQNMCDGEIFDHSDHQMVGSNAYMDGQPDEGMNDQFFEDIKSTREMIQVLRNNNERIQNIKAKYAKAIKSQQEKDNSIQMSQILSQNSSLYSVIKERLKTIQDQVVSAKKNEPNEPQTRMKNSFYVSLSKEAAEVLKQQQNFEQEYKNTVQDKVKRQVRLIDRDIDDEQIKQFVRHPEMAQQLLQGKIYGNASMTLKNTVNDIQDKFRDIQRLDASVQQCVQLFNELAILVQGQGEQIDNIYESVQGTKEYVQKGEKKLKQAKQHHKWSKKCLCFILIGLIVVVVIVVIIIVATKV